LTRLVGAHWARWLAMAGQEIDAQEAKTIGLVHAIYAEDVFQDSVQAFARTLASLPREAVGLSKLTINASATVDRGTGRDIERLANSAIIFSHDFQSRLAAFNARKNP
jgi:enoyl-CoA hydratase